MHTVLNNSQIQWNRELRGKKALKKGWKFWKMLLFPLLTVNREEFQQNIQISTEISLKLKGNKALYL